MSHLGIITFPVQSDGGDARPDFRLKPIFNLRAKTAKFWVAVLLIIENHHHHVRANPFGPGKNVSPHMQVFDLGDAGSRRDGPVLANHVLQGVGLELAFDDHGLFALLHRLPPARQIQSRFLSLGETLVRAQTN